MKITKFAVLSFFLFTFSTTSFASSFHAEDLKPVLDVTNKEVRSDLSYFIDVATPDDDIIGGLAVGESSNGVCPRDVVLTTTKNMLPVTISPSKLSDSPVIRENTNVTVKFTTSHMCRAMQSLVWTVKKDASLERYIVTTGGTIGLDRFKITKYKAHGHDNWYKLSYCPPIASPFCVEIGYVNKDGVRYMVLSTDPFPIVFRRSREPRIEYKLPSM